MTPTPDKPAASDDEVEFIIKKLNVIKGGGLCGWAVDDIEEACRLLVALSAPTKASAVDKVGRGWEPASAATPGLAYLGAFRHPICKEKWEITGLIQLSDGEFKNYFGSWDLIEKVLLIPSLTNHSDLTEGKK